MKSAWGWTMALAIALGAVAARAETVDQIAELAKQGLGEEVLLAAVERTEQGFTLGADQIIKLKESGVPQTVIAAMLKKKAPGGADAPLVIAPAQEETPARGQGKLNLENVDGKAWGYRLDPKSRTLWITPPGGAESVLKGHAGVSLAAPAGNYAVRYAGEGTQEAVAVREGGKSLLLVSRVETAEFEGLYVSVFEDGERRGGGRLAVLRETKARVEDQAASRSSYEYIAPKKDDTVVQRVVERERVVEPTTVIYRDSGYSYPYYYGSYYYPSYYYRPYRYCHPYNSVGFGYSHYGRRSGFSVGIGFGF
ncbi:MAG: hypothetical protein M5U26_00920 [Planctomycetota bacterium]|nr:hypothetical protein [Planctomycetota bacterium]